MGLLLEALGSPPVSVCAGSGPCLVVGFAQPFSSKLGLEVSCVWPFLKFSLSASAPVLTLESACFHACPRPLFISVY